MNVIGIIAEYNPFHNGHLYHINKIKEMYPDSIIICVLSTSFSQRGDISLLNKWDKTLIALKNKVDIVLELPYFFTVQSADRFARASLQILNEFKIDTLVFGSESNDLEKLKVKNKIRINDKNNCINYPTWISKNINIPDTPNDILGYFYINEIKNNNYNINPVSIKRTNNYHDINGNNNIVSASNIRNKFYNSEKINSYIPKEVNEILNSKYIDNALYTNLLKSKIASSNDIYKYLDVIDGLDNRIRNIIFKYNDIDSIIKNIKSKRYTYSKISRMLNHILIGVTKDDAKNIKDIEYIRILGFSNVGKKYLNKIKKQLKYPIIYNYSKNYAISEYELKSTIIYSLLTNDNKLIDIEYKKNVIKY